MTTKSNESKTDLFNSIDNVKAEALKATAAFSNKRDSERQIIKDLTTEIETLKAAFEEASELDNDDKALSLLTKQKEAEIQLEMRQKKQVNLEDKAKKEIIFKTEADKICEAETKLHQFAVSEIATRVAELLALMEELGAREEELRDILNSMAFDCDLAGSSVYYHAYQHCNYTVKRSVLGKELYKAVKHWAEAYNGDPNSLYNKGHL